MKPVFIEDNVLSSIEVTAALHASLPHVAGVRLSSMEVMAALHASLPHVGRQLYGSRGVTTLSGDRAEILIVHIGCVDCS